MLLSSFLTLLQDEMVSGFVPRIRHARRAGIEFNLDLPYDLDRLNAEEAAHRKTVDKAITYWVANRHWPLFTPIVAEFCLLRFVTATHLLKALGPLRLDARASEHVVLIRLLIHHWRSHGLPFWRARAGLTPPPTSAPPPKA